MATELGRQISYGLGKESSRGTAVSAGHWIRHLSADFQDRTDKVLNESAQGVVDKYNDSDIARQWGEGNIEGKVQDASFGIVLLGALGSVATVANGDASGIVYDHTFTVTNSVTPQALTVVQKSGNLDRAYALGMVDSFELSAEVGDYAKFSLGLVAKPSASASSTVAFVDENEFTTKHMSVKFANDVASLGGATAIEVEDATISIAKSVEPFYAYGDVAPTEIHANAVEVTGTITLIFDDTTYEDLWKADTHQAVQLQLLNSDVTIGTAENPTITIEIPKATIESVDLDQSLDSVVKQTVNFRALYDTTETKTVDVVLTNLETSY